MKNLVMDVNRWGLLYADNPAGRHEPYVWCFGICIDEACREPDLRHVIRRTPLPRNPGNTPVREGESTPIPSAFGRFDLQIAPIFGAFSAGVLVIASDHHRGPAETMRVAHDECARTVDTLLRPRVQKWIRNPLGDGEERQLKSNMEDLIRERMKQSLRLGTSSLDDNVATGFFLRFFADSNVAFSGALALELKLPGARYRVTGQCTYTP